MVPDTIRVALAEDNAGVRAGIRKLLSKARDIRVIGEASNGDGALQVVNDLEPDVLLLDVELPLLSGIDVAREIKRTGKKTRVLVLSAYDDQEYIREMLFNGASGYLIKDEAPDRILAAVRGVAQGNTDWISPKVHEKLRNKNK